jgi:hypothetical protein
MAARIVTSYSPPSSDRASRGGLATVASVLASLLLASGCSVRMHGVQSTGAGSTASVSSSQLSGSTRFSGGQAAFSSGGRPASTQGGGHVSLGRGPAAVLIVGLLIADAVDYLGARFAATPKPGPRTDSILETCSCYQNPVNRE